MKQTVLNKAWVVSLILTLIMAFFTVCGFLTWMPAIGMFFVLFFVLLLFLTLVTPPVVIFDEERLWVCYLFGLSESVRWNKIGSVEIRHGLRFPYLDEYVIPELGAKRTFFMQNSIPRTKTTRKLLYAHWDGTAVGEQRPEQD